MFAKKINFHKKYCQNMKKITFLILLITCFYSNVFANDPFQKIDTDKEFEQLNKIERFINSNDGTTLEDLQMSNSSLLENINISANIDSSITNSDLPGNIPPFWWGFCLSVAGLLIVLIMADGDKDLTKKAALGCILSAVVGCVAYVGIYVYIFGNAFLWANSAY